MQAFLESAQARTAFQPLPMPGVQLSPAEQCRVRDRSTIMARQLFAERGDEFADAQARAACRLSPWERVPVSAPCRAAQLLGSALTFSCLPGIMLLMAEWQLNAVASAHIQPMEFLLRRLGSCCARSTSTQRRCRRARRAPTTGPGTPSSMRAGRASRSARWPPTSRRTVAWPPPRRPAAGAAGAEAGLRGPGCRMRMLKHCYALDFIISLWIDALALCTLVSASLL